MLREEIRAELDPDVDDAAMADMCAQTLVSGALTARVVDPVGFGASPVLTAVPLANPFLNAFFQQVHDQVASIDLEAAGFDGLVADLRATNVEAVLDAFGSTAAGGDPVIHFYERFLAAYDRNIRAYVGAYYTPQPVVDAIVRLVDDALRDHLGLPEGVADASTWRQVTERLGFGCRTASDLTTRSSPCLTRRPAPGRSSSPGCGRRRPPSSPTTPSASGTSGWAPRCCHTCAPSSCCWPRTPSRI